MPEALARLQRVDDLVLVDQIHCSGVDDVDPLGRLAVLDEGVGARRQGQQLSRFGGSPQLGLVDCIERRLVREELCELVGVQDSFTR